MSAQQPAFDFTSGTPGPEPDPNPTYGVAELNAAIHAALRKAFTAEVWVRGQLQGLRDRNGLASFTLVDAGSRAARHDACLHVLLMGPPRRAIERTLAAAGDLRLSEGLELRVRGFVTYHAPTGRLQLRMTGIDVEHTLGRLALDRERLLRALRVEGLLDRNRALALPLVPLRVGLVTSAGSAAHADVLSLLEASGLAFRVVVSDARVQGADAPRSVALALRRLSAVRPALDVVALVRGGGSRSDLSAFDAEPVARAVAAMPVPVLTGVGHEVDGSVADLVAHTSCPTPSAVAGLLVERVRTYLGGLDDASARVRRAADRHVHRSEAELDRSAAAVAVASRRTLHAASGDLDRRASALVTGSRSTVAAAEGHLERRARGVAAASRGTLAAATGALAGAARRVDRSAATTTAAATARLDGVERRLAGSGRRHVETAEVRLDGVEGRVGALDPVRTLARGWTITRDGDGRLVRSSEEAAEAGALVTTFADGEVRSRVEP